MNKQEEIEKAIKTCIAIEQSCGEFDGRRLAKQIMRVENELGVVIKVITHPSGLFNLEPLIKEESWI